MAVGHLVSTAPRTVLITGATGFTGSSLVQLYSASGWAVHGTYRTKPDDLGWLPRNAELHRVDLTHSGTVSDIVQRVRPDVVHHLAAQSSVAASWNDPLGTLHENSAAQHHLLSAVVKWAPAARVVIAGSCDVYGAVPADANPVDELYPFAPINPYALSKVTQDLMGYQFFAANGLAVIRSRPFLQLGPRRAPRFVAGSFALQVAEIERGLRPPRIEVGNVDLVRDFTDVRDVADAFARLADSGAPGEAYNIASGTGHSLRDMLDIMVNLVGMCVEVRTADHLTRSGEMPLLIGNAEKLAAATGWKPVVSFEQSVRDTLDYWRQRIERSRVAQGEFA